MQVKKSIFMIIFGVFLTFLGLRISSLNSNVQKVFAGENYSLEWNATDLLVLGTQNRGDVAAGVAGWEVTGRKGNEIVFKEFWKVPDSRPYMHGNDNNNLIPPRGLSPDVRKVYDVQDRTNWREMDPIKEGWLVGRAYVRSDDRAYSGVITKVVSVKDRPDVVPGSNPPGSAIRDNINATGFTGFTASCVNFDGTQCLFATGGYGYNQAHQWDGVSKWYQLRQTGLVMPLKWQVTGELF